MSDPLEAFTQDPGAARALRAGLEALATQYAGEPLERRIRDVLAGRAAVRGLLEDPTYAALASERMAAFQQEWSALSAAERAALVEQGEELLRDT